MAEQEHRCQRCGSRLVAGLVASPRRACCLNATSEGAGSDATEPSTSERGGTTRDPIVGVCPEHGPVGSENAVDDEST